LKLSDGLEPSTRSLPFLATHLCDVTRPATSAVTGYEGPGWTGQLEQQLMPLLQDYGSVVWRTATVCGSSGRPR
jgi:hypothetical protein